MRTLVAALTVALSTFAAPQDAGRLTPDSAGFASVVDSRSEATLRLWMTSFPTVRFHRLAELTRTWLEARRSGLSGTAELTQDLRFLRDVIGEAPPAPLLDRVLLWSDDEVSTFFALEADLVRAAKADPLPEASSIESLRLAADELGCGSLLMTPIGQVVEALYGAGRLDEAEELVAWVGALAAGVGDPWKEAWSAEWSGQTAWQRGDLHVAVDRLSRAVELDEPLGDGAYRTRLLCNLASVHLALSELGRALELAEEAERLARTLPDPDPLRVVLELRSGLLFDLGEHQNALQVCLRALMGEGARPRDDLTELHLNLTAANILSDVGRVESATSFARRALALARRPDIVRVAPRVEAAVLLVLGLTLGDRGETEEALSLLRSARAQFAEAGDELGVAWSDKNEGWVHLAAGDADSAAAALERARKTAAKQEIPYLEGLSALGVAEALMTKSSRTAEDDAALRGALRTAQGRATALGDAQLLWRTETVQGRLDAEASDWQEALTHFDRAVELIERWRKRLDAPGLLTHSLRNKADPYVEAVFAAAHLQDTEAALRYSELLRARVLAEARSRRTGPLGAPSAPALRQVRRRIAEAERALREAGLTVEEQRARRAERASAEAALDELLLVSELTSREGAPRSEPARASPLNAGALRAALGALGVQALSFVPGSEGTVVLAADADGLTVHCLEVDEDELRTELARLHAPVDELRRGTVDLAHLDFDHNAARRLEALLFGALRAAGSGLATDVVIVPGGVLSALPFEALVTGGAPDPIDPRLPFAHLRGLEFLAQQHRISYASSLRALLAPPTPSRNAIDALALIPPADLGVQAAGTEVDALRTALGDAVDVVHDATPADIRGPRAERASVLHLVAHGQADSEYPTHGSLLFGAENAEAPAGERLEAWEIEQLHLSANVTVLSACETARGTWYHGEGVLGLARSFLAAGSEHVVASRWAVEDLGTATLMASFYRQLAQGTPPAEALHLARLEVLATNDPRGLALAHPYFWGAWMVQRG